MGAVPALAFVILTASLVSACGDGGGEQATLTKAEFIERASAICRRTSQRIEIEFTAYGESSEAREAERAQRANEFTADEANRAAARVAETILIPAMRHQAEELHRLGVPSEDDARAEALLEAFDEGIEKAEARPERAAKDGTEAFGRAGRLADEYGVTNC